MAASEFRALFLVSNVSTCHAACSSWVLLMPVAFQERMALSPLQCLAPLSWDTKAGERVFALILNIGLLLASV